LQTNLHPDGHIYLHGVAGSAIQLHTYTLFNRVECKNTGKDVLRIGTIRLMRAPHLPQSGNLGIHIKGLDKAGSDTILRPGETLFVYLAFATAIPAGYIGMLDIPVLGHTGVHAHVFISRTYSSIYQRRPFAVQSGVYPVFVYEGLRLSLEAGGSSGTLQPRDSTSGEGLRLKLAALAIPKGNWALPPPKDPKYSVFQSSNPLVYAREDLASAVTPMVDGALLPLLKPQEGLKLLKPAVVDGELEQKLQSIWPKQQEDGLAVLSILMADGELDIKPAIIKTTWPQQGDAQLLTAAPEMADGQVETKIYSTLDINEEPPLLAHVPQIIDSELETS